MKKYENIKVIITQKWFNIFIEQLKWRENVYGTPLPTIQKIKAARAVSHQIFPHQNYKYRGEFGHELREKFRKTILKKINVDYKKQTNKRRR